MQFLSFVHIVRATDVHCIIVSKSFVVTEKKSTFPKGADFLGVQGGAHPAKVFQHPQEKFENVLL